ncbi:thymidylate synthase [Glaciecola petra]|uniref:Thymidylate synthase n=1 Tax=Glaciecola petra TaxID=3075602 RepID=A0ABU2ZS10_9ALTE|nr:thymidylate synthase [Aestuariibacter sp. P117]MDT0595424.1 thymidylate synthase [Aestuariibacter sp. P117]
MTRSSSHQYETLCQRIIDQGQWVENERTGIRCLTLINADLEYDVAANEFPLVTTRKCFYKAAIAELLGYLRAYDSAAQFREIGCKTWDANANENKAWLANPARKGLDDMGRVYGVQGRNWLKPDGSTFDQLQKVVNNLKNGIDDRGEIVTFYNPGEFDLGCLRPCMHTHTFSILADTLYLTSYMRSCDVPLGLTFNMPQCFVLLALMAQITGLKPGKVYHKIVNAHIYENQLDLMQNVQLKRTPYAAPSLSINPKIKSLEDIETWVSKSDFEVTGYQAHEAIAYPFAV